MCPRGFEVLGGDDDKARMPGRKPSVALIAGRHEVESAIGIEGEKLGYAILEIGWRPASQMDYTSLERRPRILRHEPIYPRLSSATKEG
jgi:hypothetical protein